jgi:hypothetical protein
MVELGYAAVPPKLYLSMLSRIRVSGSGLGFAGGRRSTWHGQKPLGSFGSQKSGDAPLASKGHG